MGHQPNVHYIFLVSQEPVRHQKRCRSPSSQSESLQRGWTPFPARFYGGRSARCLDLRNLALGEAAVLLDVRDAFDPVSASQNGVVLSQLLWVRPGGGASATSTRRRFATLDQVLMAADLLLQSGGFGLVVLDLASLSLRPTCPVTGDIITTRLKDMAPEVTSADVDGETAVQLSRYKTIGDLIRRQVNGHLAGKCHVLTSNWSALLDKKFGADNNEEEKRARLEKAAALNELGEARFSILAGPAGAGKTSVLGIFCAQKEIQGTGLLLLAPTGKARVRMQELAKSSGAKAQTIAQFLNQHGRYDGASGRYIMTGGPQETAFGTVIVDEASMLTEDMLGALFDALQGVKRFVFVGDRAQLPPIGAGRPFVDIIAKLRPADCESRFPRVTSGYAELTIEDDRSEPIAQTCGLLVGSATRRLRRAKTTSSANKTIRSRESSLWNGPVQKISSSS